MDLGSFTGNRIGVSTVKALALPKNLDIIAINSLLAMAINSFMNVVNNKDYVANTSINICSMIDARNSRCYFAMYSICLNSKNKLKVQVLEDVSSDEISAVKETSKKYSIDLFLADNMINFSTYFENILEVLPTSESILYLYIKSSKEDLKSYLTNTFTLDVIYARVSKAERMRNGDST